MRTKIPLQQKKELKKRFLEELRSVKGNVQAACQNCGIKSRATFYNWKKADEEFCKESEKILAEEVEKMHDFVEGILFTLIKQKNVAATIFYLKTRHPSYCPKQLLEIESKEERELTKEDKKFIEQAIDYAVGQIQKENNGE